MPELGEQLLEHHRFLDPGKSLIESLESIGEPFVVDAQLMQDRGVEVAYLNWVLCNFVSKFVRLPVSDATFDATTCHPDGEGILLVIATAFRG